MLHDLGNQSTVEAHEGPQTIARERPTAFREGCQQRFDNMSVLAILANVMVHRLNFTANCFNLALGLQVWNNWDTGETEDYECLGLGNATSDNNQIMDYDGPGGSDGPDED